MWRSNRFLIIYYALLLLVFASRQGTVAHPLILRVAFMVAVFLPCIISRNVSFPAIVTLFTTLTSYGFAYSYMPYMLYIYAGLTLLFSFYYLSNAKGIHNLPGFLTLFAFYLLIIDSITGAYNSGAHFPEDSFYCFLILICFSLISRDDKTRSYEQMSLCFMMITIVLSLYFLLNRDAFAVNYDPYQEFERIGWIDPNYFGTVLGMGVVMALISLFDVKRKDRPLALRIVSVFTVVVALPVLLLNASRGAILSVAVSGVVLFMFTKVKVGYKVLLVIIVAAAMVYLYNNQYMDLLAYRISSDDSGGSGRVSIWLSKLRAFFHGGLFHVLFGFGYVGGLNVSGYFIGFHNDFLAFLVDYGIVGLGLFLYMMIYPILRTPRNSVQYPQVLGIVGFLVITGITLEPMNGGRLPYYVFYLQALLLANSISNKKISRQLVRNEE